MAGIWNPGFDHDSPTLPNLAERDRAHTLERTLRDLEHEVARLTLLNQALWELLRDRCQLNDEVFERKITEVDLRDGIQDGQVTHGPLQCPKCGRISNSRHWRCLYCGLQFEKPVSEYNPTQE